MNADDLDFRPVDDGRYRMAVPTLGLTFDIDRLRRDHYELIGELTVACELPGARTIDGILSIATFNLSSATARTQRAKLLREQSESELDFSLLLEAFCKKTIDAERSGAPARPLSSYERPGPDAEFDVNGWRLLRDHPTIMFGDGGSAKSYLALHAAGVLASQGVQVLVCDWELSGGDHHDRLVRLFGETPPTVFYLRCDRPLVDEVDRIRRETRRLSIEYVIYDSIAPACGGPPEAAEHATAYFRCTRQVGLGALHVAHVNKSDSGDQKPFGSSFWHNLARSTFFIKQADLSADGRQLTVGVFNRKANLGPVRPAIGFSFTFENQRTVVKRTDLADSELAPRLSIAQRMMSLLRQRPRPVAEIASELEVSTDAVKKVLSRNVKLFTRVPSSTGADLIGLPDRRIQ